MVGGRARSGGAPPGDFARFDQDDDGFARPAPTGDGDGDGNPFAGPDPDRLEADPFAALFPGPDSDHLDADVAPSPQRPARRAGPPARRRRRGRRRRRRPVLTALAVVVAVIVIVAAAGWVWVDDQISPGRPGPLVAVDIAPGTSTSGIAHLLAADGVVHDATLFEIYVRLRGAGDLLAGNYKLPRNSSYGSVIAALEAGPKILTDRLVIPPGFTVAQIATAVGALPGLGLSAQKFLAAADSGQVRSPYEPAGVDNLEGLLFPDTYDVAQGETELDVLQNLVDEFDTQAQALGLAAAAARLGYSPYQVVEVASIVEREAKIDSERPDVASTLYNRMRIGMPLGADSTQTYYLRLTDPTLQPTVAQLDQPSPYNTRLNVGLPPTPIADPGLASLQAAIDPPRTDYLYFVEINPDGELGFASNEAGFEQLQQECQAANLC